MSIDSSDYQRALEAAHRLPPEEQRRLINQLAEELATKTVAIPLVLTVDKTAFVC